LYKNPPRLQLEPGGSGLWTLETVCFMDTLVHIMRQLPDKANDIAREYSR